MKAMTPMELLTAENIAALAKIHSKTVWHWVKAGRFPQPDIRRPGFVRWYSTTYENWTKATAAAELQEALR